MVPLVVFPTDLLQRSQPRFVRLLLPVSEIGRLLSKRDFSHYFLYRFSIHILDLTNILPLRHAPVFLPSIREIMLSTYHKPLVLRHYTRLPVLAAGCWRCFLACLASGSRRIARPYSCQEHHDEKTGEAHGIANVDDDLRPHSPQGFGVEAHELHVLLVLVEDVVDQLAVGVAHYVVALAALTQVNVEPVVDVSFA